MNGLPLFPVTTVGSLPRPAPLLAAQRRLRQGRIAPSDVSRMTDEAVADIVREQEQAGCDIVTDGELRRDNFYSFVAEKFEGVQLMTLAEMLDVVDDKVAFERMLQTLDVPAYSISNPTCTGRLVLREPLVVEDVRFLRRCTRRPIKVTLPGPYLLTRAMYVPEVTRAVYSSKEDVAEDVVAVLRAEVRALADEGVAIVQFDEPVLSELAFAPARTRTFMCAALAARGDPAEELELAVALINRVVAGFGAGEAAAIAPRAEQASDVAAGKRAAPFRTAVHVCRGNWSRDETTLLRGGYAPLVSCLRQLAVTQLVLEYATPRAGAIVPMPGKELGLGVVNPRIDHVETPEEIRARVEQALTCFDPRQIFLNPDCGFGSFAGRAVNTTERAMAKLRAIATAAAELRAAYPDEDAAPAQGNRVS